MVMNIATIALPFTSFSFLFCMCQKERLRGWSMALVLPDMFVFVEPQPSRVSRKLDSFLDALAPPNATWPWLCVFPYKTRA